MKHSLAVLLLCVVAANAETIFVSQSGSGSGSGVDTSNRASLAFVNTASNWAAGAGKISPGDTVSLSGTFTGTLTVQGSGTSGNVITILFETGAIFAAPVWPSGAMIISSRNFVTIDGGTNGTIRATSNGPGLTTAIECYGIRVMGGSANITIRNLIIKDIYDRPQFSSDQERLGAPVHLLDMGDNVIVENCDISDGDFCIGAGWSGTSSGLIIRNNFLHRANHCISMGTTDPAGRMINPKVYNNVIDEFTYWRAGPGQGDLHLDGILMIFESAGSTENVDGFEFFNNIVGPDIGGPPIGGDVAHNTAGVYIDTYRASQFTNAKFYNNLFLANPGESWNNGFISGAGLIANNTFYVFGSTPAGKGIGIGDNTTVRNNIFYNVGSAIAIGQTMTNVSTDYNLYYGLAAGNSFYVTPGTGDPSFWGIYSSLAQWQSFGFDTHSVAGQPSLDGNYVPTAGDTLARNQGIDLSTFFTTDKRGVTRPQQGVWDKGAMEFATGGPVAPVVTASAINSTGTQFSITYGETVAFGAGGNGGMSLSSAAGAITLGTPSIAGGVITYSITNRAIGAAETVLRTYVQPGNGIEGASSLVDADPFTGVVVTNNTTVAQAATPTFSPAPGSYSSAQNISMSSTTPASTVRYTVNGTDPTGSSTLYTTPVAISVATTFKAKAFASGFMDSLIATGVYQIGDFVLANAWTSAPIATQTGTFRWTFRAIPSTASNDSVIALADHTAAAYSDLAVIVRFGPSGTIDAYNGVISGYSANNSFTYTLGQAYDFVVTINVTTHTFDVTVVPASGGTPTVIAQTYGFRGASVSAVDLDVFAGISDIGTATISNMAFNNVATGGIQTLNVQTLRIVP